jgi:multiple sugar transport system permease protein
MKDNLLIRFVFIVAAAVIIIWTLFPVYWLAVTGVKTQTDVLTRPPVWLPIPDWHFYQDVLSGTGIAMGSGIASLKDSLIISTGSTILCVVFGAMAAYVLSAFPRNVPTGGNSMAYTLLTFRMFPPIVPAIPLFWLFFILGLLDTHLSLIIAFTTFNLPFAIYMMKTFFDDIPRPILDAGLLDGYSPFKLFRKIALPLVMPGLVSVTALCFIFAWNEFLMSLILTATNVRPYTVELAVWMTSMEIPWADRAALAVIGIIPPIVLVWILRERLVRGMTLGAVR